MPFQSKAQQRFLYAHPEKVGGKEHLKEWASKTDFSHLPNKAKKKKIKKSNHQYCSTQVNLSKLQTRKILKWANENIKPTWLYYDEKGEGGFEYIPHCTVCYGIEDSPDAFETLNTSLKDAGLLTPSGVMGKIKMFPKKDSDVLVIEVISPEFKQANKIVKDTVETKEEDFGYNPHITIAYLKKGIAPQFVGNEEFKGLEFSGEIVFSNLDREHTKFKKSLMLLPILLR